MDILRVTDPMQVATVHAILIEPHFPPEERSSANEFLAATTSGRQTVWGARSGSDWIGCAVIERFTADDVVLLDWLAVAPPWRSRGLGTRLVRTVLRQLPTLGAKLLIAEIEDPGRPHHSEAHGDPARRGAFYEALGAKAILVPHRQPAMRPELPPVPLLLIALAPEPLGASLPCRPLRDALREYEGQESWWPAVDRALSGGSVELAPISPAAFARSQSLT